MVRDYHERTKHHPHRYAAALGSMDWATQPNPFRSYEGAECFALQHPPLLAMPTYDQLFGEPASPESWSLSFVSRLFYDSLAISAWKQAPGARWSLRINPSSGALQPTESYLIAGPIPGLTAAPAIYHYNVYLHALEKRLELTAAEWQSLAGQIPGAVAFVGLTSIYWRESWKYGERAYRYCHHDVGHALGTVAFSARMLGWQTHLANSIADDDLAVLLGVHQQQGPEAEHPDGLLVMYPSKVVADVGSLRLPSSLLERLRTAKLAGMPNQLSKGHHDWPIIDAVARAANHTGGANDVNARRSRSMVSLDRSLSAQQIVRQRRSAVDMDGETSMSRAAFYLMMQRVLPTEASVFGVLPWRPRVSLAVFVHRVTGMERGLYLLVRDPAHRRDLLSNLRSEFDWRQLDDCDGCPEGLELYQLLIADTRRAAKMVSCHQDIAADGAFSLGMLAQFDAALREEGPSRYPRLFWETGLIGQVLYLEAEAAAIRATGIGCFFDDSMHEVLGIRDHSWQSLYHFTVGRPVDDPRLKTLAPYHHLQP